MEQETKDSLFEGKLLCTQHKNGYRFSLDAVLLAHFISPRRGERLLDLGTGCGILPLVVLFRSGGEGISCAGIEIQSGLAELARKNFVENGYDSAASVIKGDIRRIRELVAGESFQQVMCNPPFYPAQSGRISKNREAAMARHQGNGGLVDFLRAARFALVNRGRASFISPAEQCG